MSQSHQTTIDINRIQQKYKGPERVTGPAAARMIEQVGLLESKATTEPLAIFDNACGSGIGVALLQDMLDRTVMEQSRLVCGDIVPPMAQAAEKRIEAGRWASAEAKVVDAQVSKCYLNC